MTHAQLLQSCTTKLRNKSPATKVSCVISLSRHPGPRDKSTLDLNLQSVSSAVTISLVDILTYINSADRDKRSCSKAQHSANTQLLTISLNLYMYLDFPLLSFTSFDTNKHMSKRNRRRSRPFLINCFGSQMVKLSCSRTSPSASRMPCTDKLNDQLTTQTDFSASSHRQLYLQPTEQCAVMV